jgi:ubiquinone/menaquinone biosynthesis C-methylase UbiE
MVARNLKAAPMYIPDFRGRADALSKLKDLYLRIFGLPFLQRRIEARYVFGRALHVKPGDLALDVGSGDGLFTIELARRGAKAYGIDIEDRDLDRGRARVQSLGLDDFVELQPGDGQKLPFPDNMFDHVVSNCTIEHIPDDSAALREMHRVLKPGGTLALTVPADPEQDGKIPLRLLRWALRRNRRFKDRFFRRWTVPYDNIEAFCIARLPDYNQVRYGYAVDELRKKMNDAGFDVVDWRPHLKLFGVFGSDCIDVFKVFDIYKTHSGAFGYAARHEWIYAITFPIFYAMALADEFTNFNGFNGFGIAGRKPGQ